MKFIKSVIHEMTLVTWPTAKETRRDTTTVIITSLLFAAYFALADWVILLILKAFIFLILISRLALAYTGLSAKTEAFWRRFYLS